jgi:hypothetical protein
MLGISVGVPVGFVAATALLGSLPPVVLGLVLGLVLYVGLVRTFTSWAHGAQPR